MIDSRLTPAQTARIAELLGYDSMFRNSLAGWRFDHFDGIQFTDMTSEQVIAALLGRIGSSGIR